MSQPKVGEIIDGYRFNGGDPSSQDSWSQGPSAGDVVDGYKFVGGDPGEQDSWVKDEKKGLLESIGLKFVTPGEGKNFKAPEGVTDNTFTAGAPEDVIDPKAVRLPGSVMDGHRVTINDEASRVAPVSAAGYESLKDAASRNPTMVKGDSAVARAAALSQQDQTPSANAAASKVLTRTANERRAAEREKQQAWLKNQPEIADAAITRNFGLEGDDAELERQRSIRNKTDVSEAMAIARDMPLGEDPTTGQKVVAGALGTGAGRVFGDWESGVLGATGSSLSHIGRKAGIDIVQQLGDSMQSYSERGLPSDPTFVDKVVSGFGSMGAFMVPGLGVMRGAEALAVVSQTAAKWAGAGTMAAIEGAGEADNAYKESLKQGLSEQEASSRAEGVFWQNMVLLGATDKLGFFNDLKTLGKKVLAAKVSEGGQEYVQQLIQNNATDKPLTEGANEAGAIGAIIGGGSAAVQHMGQPTSRDIFAQEMTNAVAGTTFTQSGIEREAVAALNHDRAQMVERIAGAPDVDTAIAEAVQATTGSGHTATALAIAQQGVADNAATMDAGSDIGIGGTGNPQAVSGVEGGLGNNAEAPVSSTGENTSLGVTGADQRSLDQEILDLEAGVESTNGQQQPPGRSEAAPPVVSGLRNGVDDLNARVAAEPERFRGWEGVTFTRHDELPARPGEAQQALTARRAEASAITALIEASGAKVHFVTTSDGTPRFSGTYIPGMKGHIFVDADAHDSLTHALRVTAAHEAFHDLEYRDKEAYDDLVAAVREHTKFLSAKVFNPIYDPTGQTKLPNLNRAISEQMANLFGNAMHSPAAVSEMLAQIYGTNTAPAASLVKRMIATVKKFIAQLGSKYDTKAYAGNDLAKIEKILRDGYVAFAKKQGMNGTAAEATIARVDSPAPPKKPGSDNGHARTKNGDYVGAPAGMTPGKLGALRTKLKALTKEGEPGRFWYEDSSKVILAAAEGDKAMAEKLAGLLAIYSPNATVSGNTTMGLKALYQWANGDAVKVRFGPQNEKAEAWMNGTMAEEDALQIKTGAFFKNLMRKIDEERYGFDKQGATIDMWMARVFGYGSKAIGSDARYYFAEREVKKIADEIGWEPQQVQAALWVAIKSRIESIADTAREWGKKNDLLNRVERKSGGKTNVSWEPVDGAAREKYEGHILKLALATEADPSGLTKSAYHFGTALRERVGQISWEAMPGKTTGVLPGIFDAPLEQQTEYLVAMDQALRDENGQDLIAKKLHLPIINTAMGPSAWQLGVGAGAQSEVVIPAAKGEGVSPAAKALLNTYAAIRGYVLNQEAVVWHLPFFDAAKKNANGVQLDFGRDPTHDEIVELYRAIHEVSGRDDWAPAFVPGVGVRVLNFSDVSNLEFHKLIDRAVLEKTDLQIEGFKTFQSDGDYIANDWLENPDGSQYKEIIDGQDSKLQSRGSGRSGIQGWVESELRPRAERVNKEFAEKYGWDKVPAERDDDSGEGPRNSPVVKQEKANALRAMWLQAAENEDIFQFPKSEATTLEGVFKGIDPGIRVSERYVDPDTDRKKRVKKWVVFMPDGKDAEVHLLKTGRIYIDASQLKSGMSSGSMLYAGVLNFAHNAGHTFVGDPAGVSGIATFRRTENMLSAALKFGTTDFMEPSYSQVKPKVVSETFVSGGPVMAKLEDMPWEAGNDTANLAALLNVSYTNVKTFVPEIENVRYDFAEEDFKWTLSDRLVTREEWDRLSRELRAGLSGVRGPLPGAGDAGGEGGLGSKAERSATLKRAALSNTVLREEGSEGARSVLAASGQKLLGKVPASLEGVLYSPAARAQTETPSFKKWSNGNALIRIDESHEYHAGEGVVIEGLHGTTGDFNKFDTAYAHIESDLGGGFYFTNSTADVGENYAGLGPDLTNKVEQEAERIESESDGDIDMEEARDIAKQKYMANLGSTMPVYVRFDNPVVLGGSNETFLDIDKAYDEENDEYGEPTGKLVDFVEALREVGQGERYGDADIEQAISDIWETANDNGGLAARELIEILSSSEGLQDATDYESDRGAWASKEIIRQAFAQAGFDGFIDQTVNQKFGSEKRVGKAMQGMDENTVHFIAFRPTQIKSRIGNNGDFDAANSDIRYSPVSQFSESRFDKIAQDFTARVTAALEADRVTQPVMIHSNTPASMQILGWADRRLTVEPSELLKISAKPGFETDDKIGALVYDLARPGAMFWNEKQGSLNILRRSDMRGAPALIAIRPDVRVGISGRDHLMVTAHRLANQEALLKKINSGELKSLYLDTANSLVKQAMQKKKYRVSTSDLLAPENLHARADVQLGMSSRLLAPDDLVKWESDNWGDKPLFSPPARNFLGLGIAQSWQSTDPTGYDGIVRKLQDKLVDTKRVIYAIKEAGVNFDSRFDPYSQEILFHGRSAKMVHDFADFELKPLLQRMQLNKIEIPELEAYLWALHAEERNDQIATINPTMPDGGSGLTNAEARDLLAGVTVKGVTLNPAKMAQYKQLAAMVRAISDKTLDTLVAYGLETQETVDMWRATYPNYVPLMRDMDADNNYAGVFGLGQGTGQGFSVKGPASKRAMGSERTVIDILANVSMQRERAIVRGEKNRVAKATYGLALKAPNPDFWLPINPDAPKQKLQETINELIRMGLSPNDANSIALEPTQQYIDPATGIVMTRINPSLRTRDDVLAVRVDGKDRFLFFSSNPRAQQMVRNLKNLDAEQLGPFMQLVATGTRWFASVNTQYNPVFGLVNGVRDFQSAMLNLTSTPLAGQQKKIAAYGASALRGIYVDLREHRAGRPAASAWAQEFEEFGDMGGQTGYRDMFQNSKARTDELTSVLKELSTGKVLRWAKISEVNPIFAWLSDYNTAIENAFRVAAYKAAKESGMSKDDAAILAKNLTVNFNKKGLAATQTGAFYAFFNAAVQGTARIGETMLEHRGDPSDFKNLRLSKKGKLIVTGGLLLGVMQGIMGFIAGWDDDEPPEFVREKSYLQPIFGTDKYASIPLSLGYHVLPNMGRLATEYILGGFKEPGKYTINLVNVMMDAFNPVGGSGGLFQMALPTVLDPIASLDSNKDWNGRKIYKEDFNTRAPTPGWTRAKDTATPWAKGISYGINWATGAFGPYEKGRYSPTPDQIDYLIGQITGGVGRELGKTAQTTSAIITGEDLPLYKIPVVGRFSGETHGTTSEVNRFFKNMERVGAHKDPIKRMLADGQDQKIQDYIAEHPEATLVKAAEETSRRIAGIDKLRRKTEDREAVKNLENRKKVLAAEFNRMMKERVTGDSVELDD